MNAHARTSAGFTLLELLIAIALFALLGLGTYRMLEAVLQSDEAVHAQELQLRELSRAVWAFERDLQQVVGRPIRDGFGDERNAVGDHHMDAPVLEGAAAEVRHVFAAGVDDRAVDFHKGGLVDIVAQHLAQDTAIAAADDEHGLHVPVGEQGHVGEHFVIGELVPFRGLDDPVKGKNPAEGRVVEDDQVLEFGLLLVDDAGDLETLGVSVIEPRVMQPLVEPPHRNRPRLCSEICMEVGAKARRSTGTAL